MKLVIVLGALLLLCTSVVAYDYNWAAQLDAEAAVKCFDWRIEMDEKLVYDLPSWAPCPYACHMGIWAKKLNGTPVCIRPHRSGGAGNGVPPTAGSPLGGGSGEPDPEPEPTCREECERDLECIDVPEWICWPPCGPDRQCGWYDNQECEWVTNCWSVCDE
jgi:hypothetical protein